MGNLSDPCELSILLSMRWHIFNTIHITIHCISVVVEYLVSEYKYEYECLASEYEYEYLVSEYKYEYEYSLFEYEYPSTVLIFIKF